MLSPGLHGRYALAATRILQFWQESRCSPIDWEQFDVAASMYLEHIFCEGYPKGFGSDGLAALQHFVPEVAGKLRHSWRLLKSWNKMEPPMRVLPISPLIVLAMSGACIRLRKIHCAAAFLLCFDTLLRPGELYSLRKQDFTWAAGKAVVSLRNTKTGQRKGAEEMVVCHSEIANFWPHKALQYKAPGDYLLSCSSRSLRTLFFTILEHFGVQGHFSMYSFRRGGATWHFLAGGSMGGNAFTWPLAIVFDSQDLPSRCCRNLDTPTNHPCSTILYETAFNYVDGKMPERSPWKTLGCFPSF